MIFLKRPILTELTKNLPGCSEHKSSLPYKPQVVLRSVHKHYIPGHSFKQ